MNFFLDNTFSPQLAQALALVARVEGHVVTHLLERYNKDPGDLVWIEDAATWAGEWIILSGDRHIATNPQRRAALAGSRRTAFFMPSGFPDLDRWAQASRLFKWFSAIASRARKTKTPQIFEVRMNGAIEPMR